MKKKKSNTLMWIALALALGGVSYVVIKKVRNKKQQPIPNYKTGVLISNGNALQNDSLTDEQAAAKAAAKEIRSAINQSIRDTISI